MAAPRVLIVDDHDAFRSVARTVLEADGFDVVGEANDGAAAIAEYERTRPDVVLLDILLPGPDGFEIARRLLDSGEGPVVVLVSSRSAAAYARRLAATGASAFIEKHQLTGAALRRIIGGGP